MSDEERNEDTQENEGTDAEETDTEESPEDEPETEDGTDSEDENEPEAEPEPEVADAGPETPNAKPKPDKLDEKAKVALERKVAALEPADRKIICNQLGINIDPELTDKQRVSQKVVAVAMQKGRVKALEAQIDGNAAKATEAAETKPTRV